MILMCTSCQSEQDRLYSEVFADVSSEPSSAEMESSSEFSLPSMDDSIQKELTIRLFSYDETSIEVKLAKLYQREHPNVTIHFDYELTVAEQLALDISEYEPTRDGFNQRVRAELMSGEADYLLFFTRTMDTYKMAKNGILMDLRPFFDNDPEINPDNYFLPVLDAFSVDGKLAQIPMSFNLRCAFLNRQILEDIHEAEPGTATSDQLLDWYEAARELNPELQFGFSAPGKDILFTTEAAKYMNLETGIATFDSPDCIRFLERTAALINDEPAWNPETDYNHINGPESNQLLRHLATGEKVEGVMPISEHLVTNGRESFATIIYTTMLDLMFLQEPMEYMAGPVMLQNTYGQTRVSSTSDWCVPSSISDSALAWDFIKFCISCTDCDAGDDTSIPLNKDAFLYRCEFMPMWFAGSSGYGQCEEPDGEELLRVFENVLSKSMVNTQFYAVDVDDILDDYYNKELITAQQCAKELQERVTIWLNE